MNELIHFNNPAFGEIRTTIIDGEPWFVGKDVAEVLGYTNPQKAIRDHCEEEDRTVNESFTVNGTQGILINESGLYSLILSSKLPTAKQFKRWVTSEVLPAIRKDGGYIHAEAGLTDDEIMARAHRIAEATIERLERKNRQLSADNSRLTVEAQIMAPKADYFDQLVDRNLLTNFRDTAKMLGLKPKTFINWLLSHKYIYRDQKSNLRPYAGKHEDLFEIKECVNDKTAWAGTQTMITPKGRETFRLLTQGM